MLKKQLLSRHIYSQRQWWQARTVVTNFFYYLSHVNSVQSTDKFQTFKSPLKWIKIETHVAKIIAFKNYILSTLLPPVLCSTLSPRRETPSTTGLLYQCIPHTLTTTYNQVWIQTTTARSQQHFLIYDPSNTGVNSLGDFKGHFTNVRKLCTQVPALTDSRCVHTDMPCICPVTTFPLPELQCWQLL